MATVTLIPNGAGSNTGIESQYPPSTYHWDKVDDPVATPDDNATYVFEGSTHYDLYAVPDQVLSGTISDVTIYARMGVINGNDNKMKYRLACKTEGTVYYGTQAIMDAAKDTWKLFSSSWATNPNTSAAWTWTQINAIEIGIEIDAGSSAYYVFLTQLYAVVTYEAAAGTVIPVFMNQYRRRR